VAFVCRRKSAFVLTTKGHAVRERTCPLRMFEPNQDPLKARPATAQRIRELLEQSRHYSDKMTALTRELEDVRDELRAIVASRLLRNRSEGEEVPPTRGNAAR
jgi:hypothetical protein